MTYTVISKCDNGIRSIILNRPDRLNAINPELLNDFLIALREGNADPETRVMVISGAGRAFCAGDDLKEFDDQVGTEEETRAYIESIQDITREIVLGDKIVLGAIHGWAVGGGLEWVINCDFAIMAEGTRSFFPEISLGVFVTGAVTTILPKLVGLQKAKELILLGERFDAAQALGWGLIWKVVPETDLMRETMATAARIADLPELAVRDLKRVINRACDLDVEAAMKLETDATVRGFLDPATADRISEFSK
ncbi:MAG: enoyl-CoA hydratase/isomerase family protein [Rhodospirillaceae bacterium]|nr:enoyl-CoA hydratase/isomerase family protein [Rhodospirillaceae bacterium]MBL6941277.1 enoyl-CoA hydratase/isomerase family protein [Rhodospirillales bacterium]